MSTLFDKLKAQHVIIRKGIDTLQKLAQDLSENKTTNAKDFEEVLYALQTILEDVYYPRYMNYVKPPTMLIDNKLFLEHDRIAASIRGRLLALRLYSVSFIQNKLNANIYGAYIDEFILLVMLQLNNDQHTFEILDVKLEDPYRENLERELDNCDSHTYLQKIQIAEKIILKHYADKGAA